MDPTSKPPRLRFRLVHLIYALTLLASGVATFGGSAVILGILILVFWGAVFTSRNRPETLLRALAVVLVGSCLCCLSLPISSSAREAARRMQCTNNLKQIALALHLYLEQYKAFPPAFIADEKGRPKHSWRVLILPFLEYHQLYAKYDFDEAWDGPNNRKLLDEIPAVFRCPSDYGTTNKSRECASYLAVVGRNTAWPGPRGRKLDEFADGTSNVVMVAETADSKIPWLEPRDLTVEESARLVASVDPETPPSHRHEDFFFDYGGGWQIALADGSVRYFRQGLPRAAWLELLGVNDGTASVEETNAPVPFKRRLKLGNCCRLAFFVFLMLYPLPWVWIHPTSAIERREESAFTWDRVRKDGEMTSRIGCLPNGH